MIESYQKLWAILDTRERRNALLLLGLMILMGVFEVAGIASIMPFIAVVSDPGIVQRNEWLAQVYQALDFSDVQEFLWFLGAAVFTLILCSQMLKITTYWAIARFTLLRSFTFSSRLLRSYLRKPYSWFLNNHTADLGKSVLSEVEEVVRQSLVPSVHLLANLVLILLVAALLFVVDPVVAISALVTLGGAYLLIYLAFKKYLARIGVEKVAANRQRFQSAQEVLGGIKDVKMFGLESEYLRVYRSPARKYAHTRANSLIIGQLPRYLLEGIAFGGILVVVMVYLGKPAADGATIFPMIGLYALAGYRLMPALQKLYQALTKLRFGKHALDKLHQHLTDTSESQPLLPGTGQGRRLHLQREIVLQEVTYTYPQADKATLQGFNLTVPALKTVALVGATGSGKTTVADILLGLLVPQQGSVMVDSQPITESNLRNWQQSLGYVPQSIFLTDDTIASNIAFGARENEIDMEAVEHAAGLAELHDFVINELPQGYRTMVGERGVRLSGGQRQRIGIARALYHDPDTLILDEATSALDNLTEKAVMDAVHNLSHKKTIIMIAHRMSTVRECDILFLLDKGQVVAQGSYDELLSSNEQFQSIVNG